ncbi:TetR/AcrR family transcriptional regulator [Oryzisolibacter propanilivorax]|uniref:TetR/AcrR family transcriptional regulator n=1 Tax=Oryzisolibacter propanilivorax TaxID=1527607 RepID=A0A1G9S3G6_9BURK|nr:nucleoid occlusion factor SlmA [Oryzisolibacter propanilivorax]SDM30026.1 TetR/AcrR family transcriptional regulator [Oryzisolibacter propanilivorax]
MSAAPPSTASAPRAQPARRRASAAERREQALQALVQLLQEPDGIRVTSAALARQLGCGEAALLRPFGGRAGMFEALLDFIETSVFTLVRQITGDDGQPGPDSAARIVAMVLQFAERNPGLARLMAGDTLAHESAALDQRMQRFFDKLEAQLRQCLRPALPEDAAPQDAADLQPAAGAGTQHALRAALLVDVLRGRLQRQVRSGFQRLPTERLQATLALLG